MSSTAISLSDLKELLDILAPLAGNWEVFLIALGVSGSERAVIQAQHANSPNFPTLCLVDGLERWVKSRNSPTYGNIIEALNSKFITDKPLAAQIEGFAQQKSEEEIVQSVKPAPAALPHPLSVDQPTSSGGTSCEPTCPPHQTSTTSADTHTVPAEPASQPQPSSDVDTKGACMYDKAHAVGKSKALQDRFIRCAKNLKNHLKKESTFSEFLDEFILKLLPSVKHEHEKFFDRKNSEINKASTFDELFTCLNIYWDFLNYTLLENIIEVHGTEEMQQDMEFFVRDVQDFRKKTTLNVFWQLERHRMPTKPPPGFRKFVTKHSITRESTLEDIEKIRFEITQEFHLSKFALLLIDVVEGSVLITWFVPSSIISRLQERLGSLTGLHIEDIFFESSDIPHDPPNPQGSGSLSLPASPHSTEAKHTPSIPDLTPLFHTAAGSGDADTVRKLLKDGVDVNKKREDWTAVMLAAWCGHTDTVQALAALGADIHIRNACGWTALMLAAGCGHTDTVQALAALGADIQIQDQTGWSRTALMLAAGCGHTDTVQALAALGADIQIQSSTGRTALMWAAEFGRTDTVQALAALGADIQIRDGDGQTAETLAAEHGHTDTIQALRLAALGADMHMKDRFGQTVQLAAEHLRTHEKVRVSVKFGPEKEESYSESGKENR